MISYELYCQIRLLHQERGLNFAQIARELNLDEETGFHRAFLQASPAKGRVTARPVFARSFFLAESDPLSFSRARYSSTRSRLPSPAR